jgi:selenocysteine-specific elongation factor
MTATITATEPLYFTVATAGHVDHGKTSLLRALTGIDPDRLKEEKQRQMTTDLGFAHLTIKPLQGEVEQRNFTVGFIDVPGHGKFLKNMLAGVGGIDIALLVVAADEGPMPQTVQHVKILSLLSVSKVLLVVTKIDAATAEQRDIAVGRAKELLARYSMECLQTVLVSNTKGTGIDEMPPALRRALTKTTQRGVETTLPAYLPVDRVFTKVGYGLVVTGTLVRGSFTVGDAVFIEPGGLQARIRGLESFGHNLQKANAGQRLAMNLALKTNKPLTRGHAIFAEQPSSCQTLVVELRMFEADSGAESIDDLVGQMVRVYHGTAEVPGHIRWLEKMTADEGGRIIAQISLAQAITAEPAENFVARYGDFGITGGSILVATRPRWLTRKKLVPLAKLILQQKYEEALQIFLDCNPQRMVKKQALAAILPLPQRKLVEALIEKSTLVRLGDYVMSAAAKQDLVQKFVRAVSQAKSPNVEGVALETLRTRSLSGLERLAFQQLVREAVDSGQVVKEGDKVKLPASGQPQAASADDDATVDGIMKILGENKCLEIDEIARLLSKSRPAIVSVLNQLTKEDKASIVNYDFASSNESLHNAHVILAQLWQEKREISPSDFKERLGVTRKYAMPMLSYFDDHSITRRVSNSRQLLKLPKQSV